MIISGTTVTNTDIILKLDYQPIGIMDIWYDFSTFSSGRYVIDYSGHQLPARSNTDYGTITHISTYSGGISFDYPGGGHFISPYRFNPNTDWTVVVAAQIPNGLNNPWFALFGDDIRDTEQGYLAVFTDVDVVSFGPAGFVNWDNAISATVNNPELPNIYAFVKQGTFYKIYINGELANSNDIGITGTLSTVDLTIGAMHGSNGNGAENFIQCNLFDFKVYNFPFSDGDAAFSFAQVSSRYGL
jgi:hypothetical protein